MAAMSSACQGVSMPVDPHEHFAAPETADLERSDHLRLRRLLGGRRNGILEVENDSVHGKRARLLDGAGVGARHVEHAAARPNRHGTPIDDYCCGFVAAAEN
jgi:hypothetical protein